MGTKIARIVGGMVLLLVLAAAPQTAERPSSGYGKALHDTEVPTATSISCVTKRTCVNNQCVHSGNPDNMCKQEFGGNCIICVL